MLNESRHQVVKVKRAVGSSILCSGKERDGVKECVFKEVTYACKNTCFAVPSGRAEALPNILQYGMKALYPCSGRTANRGGV